MPLRPLLVFAALAVLCQPVAAQTGLRRVQPKAFPLTVVPWAAAGFNGTRVTRTDEVTCPTLSGRDCFQYQLGNGPMIGADLQVPLASTFGLQVTASAGRPSRVVCTRGAECRSTDEVTFLRGGALFLLRFKARAPIFFGLGAAAARLDPGPVENLQDSLQVTEIGGAGLIGYDFTMASKVGVRVTWTHYLLKPSDDQITGTFQTKSLAHDWILAVGARIRLGS